MGADVPYLVWVAPAAEDVGVAAVELPGALLTGALADEEGAAADEVGAAVAEPAGAVGTVEG